MSSRQKKAQATPASSGRQSTQGTTPRSAREKSPVMISREEEKNELASLNDRLASYIDRVRRLEGENARLSRMTHEMEETVRKETDGVKLLYERELAEARRMIDQLAKDKAKFQMEVSKLQTIVQELQAKLAAKEKSESELERRLAAAESQINELQSRLNDANNQKRRSDDERARLAKELDATSKQLAIAKRDLEAESMRRAELENKNKSLMDQVAFQNQVHQKELQETVVRHRVEVEEVDGRLQQDYESRLMQSLQQMRDENDEQIRASRAEMEAMFGNKLQDAQAAASHWQEVANKSQSELRTVTKRCEELNSELSQIRSQLNAAQSRIDTLERMMQRERDEYQSTLGAKEAEIRQLKDALEDQLREYRDLLDVKIQLDAEIAAYRKLLELEETRLNLSGTSPATRSTPVTDGSGGKKRRYNEVEESSFTSRTETATSFHNRSAGKTGVEIVEVEPEGKFVKLYNSSDKAVVIANWTLKQTDGTKDVTYKFTRGVNVKPHQNLAIWSHGQTPSNPGDLVMKNQSWLSSDSSRTVIADAKNEEVACRELRLGAYCASPQSEEADSGIEQRERASSSRGFSFSLFGLFA